MDSISGSLLGDRGVPYDQVSSEPHVQKLIIEANAENLAKERLAQLAKEGIVTGLGVGRRDNREIVFVAIDAQFLSLDQSDLNVVRARLQEALQDIPFEILGHYDDSPSSDLPTHNLISAASASDVETQQKQPFHVKDEGTPVSTGAPSKDATRARAMPSVSLPGDLNETYHPPIQGEIKSARQPSKTLMAALVLAAVSGWGVSAYAVFSARQQERAYLDQISRVTAERDKGNADLNQMRAEAERNRQTLERAQADLVSVRSQLQASPPPTARDEMRRVTADRDKLNVELTQMRAEAERNRLALERAQRELADARAQSQADPPATTPAPLPSPVPNPRTRPRR